MANLKDRFEEIIHMTWSEFIALEKDKKSSVDDSILCSLIRICADTDDIAATKLAFDRIEGIQAIPIDIKIPKFYIRYLNATEAEKPKESIEAPKEEETKYDPATSKLRATLKEMRKLPQDITKVILGYKKAIESNKPADRDPAVKAIIVANLLKNVKRGRYRAVELVFDQVDGKLAKKIDLIGGQDVYVDNDIDTIAPAGAIKDENGYYIAEDKTMTNAFLRGFSRSQKGLEILAEGLDDE